MPVHRQGSGWQWGSRGKVYPTKKQAEQQARAAYANGYREPWTHRWPKKRSGNSR